MAAPSLLRGTLCVRSNALKARTLTFALRRLNSTDSTPVTDAVAFPVSPKPAMTAELEEYISAAEGRMAFREPKLMLDTIVPMNSHLLDHALADHLPPDPKYEAKKQSRRWVTFQDYGQVPDGHHLVYWPLQAPKSGLMPDGTDPDHFPGGPFVRRMWAGGSIQYQRGISFPGPQKLIRGWCVETVGKLELKLGKAPGDEKVFVEVKRQYGVAPTSALTGMSAENVLARYTPAMTETRKLVFMRERGPVKAGGEGVAPPARVVQAPKIPTYSFTLTPDPTLLFQFSALTYNAHAIHLDPDYARNQEGYPERLVHGPLLLVLMLTALRRVLDSKQSRHALQTVDYRNLAPLFVGQPVKVCVREMDGIPQQWDLWVEGPNGLAVRGTATTLPLTALLKNGPNLNWAAERRRKNIPFGKRRVMEKVKDAEENGKAKEPVAEMKETEETSKAREPAVEAKETETRTEQGEKNAGETSTK
ncbi:hypothetical protein B0T14DRAFT_494485 [Immersiella caudata]|uniref:Uncharacterized protein n=1 Tax=Immersiella caudata TaxID=314043 RepID=A0AA39WWH2_9PEZI|nr:hypothetical protein B0T14DRAFT_494485 [Immersiella caudata]